MMKAIPRILVINENTKVLVSYTVLVDKVND